MARRVLTLLCIAGLCIAGEAAGCTPSASIIRLVGIEQACTMASTAIAECGAKLQVSTYATCDMVVQPDLGVANDGTFCEPMRAAQIGTPKAPVINGKFSLGRSDLDFYLRPNPAMGVVMMNLRGRVVPPAGGREIPLDCNAMYNVTSGNVLGIASSGQDALMGTTAATLAPAATGGGYSGAGGQGGLYGGRDPAAKGRKNAAGSTGGGIAGRFVAAAAGALGLLLVPVLL